MRKYFLISMLLMIFSTIRSQPAAIDKYSADHFSDYLFEITKVMVHDVISPPAAARYYAYSTLAAYLVMADDDQPLSKQINHFPEINLEAPPEVIKALAAPYSLLSVGEELIPSGYTLAPVKQKMIDSFKEKFFISDSVISASVAFADEVAKLVIAYSGKDGYSQLSAQVAYTPTNKEGSWYPTPPAYLQAVEPHWGTMRTFFLDSASQFSPPPPTPFDLNPKSNFYKNQLMGVYNAVANRTKEQELTANFWDCNPFEVKLSGHVMIGIKKITPGGHWMGITGIAAKEAGLSLLKTAEAHALVALTLHDAFVSCWDEKYRSDRIRPETVINQHIDNTWRPVLQTPPFPEYTSGHSVASGAASTVLTHIFGENFSFVDDTEVFLGLPEREFDSFYKAAEEAAMSRYYGGIHYLDACEVGLGQGHAIGNYISRKVSDELVNDKL